MRIRLLVPVAVLALVAPAVPAASPPTAAAAPSAAPAPRLRITTEVPGLSRPWDVHELPGGPLLITQRDTATLSVWSAGQLRTLVFPSSTVWVSGETGLMGLEVDPAFASNRRVYTCQGGTLPDGSHDVRVLAWSLDPGLTKATFRRELVGGLPATTGRHGGCRLLIAADGSLLVGTGDSATGTVPQDLDSLGGKTLRLNRFSGAPWPTNPYAGEATARRYVQTYGHRNVQGLAQRADGTLWSIEQGTNRDDEVNLLVGGGDYGWNPVPGYNGHAPMTDQSLPGEQLEARWRSGVPTVATSGGTFVSGAQWLGLDGALAVACLAGQRVLFIRFDDQGRRIGVSAPASLRSYGRIRTVSNASNGDLLVAVDAPGGAGRILRVAPLP